MVDTKIARWIFGVGLFIGMGGVCPALASFEPEEVTVPKEERFLPCRPRDYKAMEDLLLRAVKKNSQGISLEELLKNSKLMTLVLAWDTIHTAGADNLNTLAGKAPKYAHFLNCFLVDPEWMTLYAGAGSVPQNTEVGLRVLADIWARDRGSSNFRKFLNLSTGIAAAWGTGPFSRALQYAERRGGGPASCNPVWRYFFFKQSQLDGRLQPDFMELRPWEIRFVAGNSWSDRSIAWIQKRVNLHPDLWGGACWVAPYCGTSEFGDTIQGPLFYISSPAQMGETERTVLHGGVCGALSHVGSTAALSHGYPSYTCGQPGHCAYAYRVKRGDWRGGFGGPHGGPHNAIFPGRAPAAVDLMEAAFKYDYKVDRSVRLLAAARLFESAGTGSLAGAAWKTILKEMPLNFNMQVEFQNYAQRSGMMKGEGKWLAYSQVMISAYSAHGYALLTLLRPLEERITAGLSPEKKLDWFLQIERALCKASPSWANEDGGFLDRMWAALDGQGPLQTRLITELLLLNLEHGNDQTFGKALEWTVKETVGKGKEKLFVDSIGRLARVGGIQDMSADGKKKIRAVYGKAIIAAEQARSLPAFTALSDLIADLKLDRGNDPDRKIPAQSGKLLSAGGLLRLSSTSGWDTPWIHRKVIAGGDGSFHTDKEDAPYAIVQLPETADISSILIVKNGSNQNRSKHLKVSRSLDGATWFPLAESFNTPSEWVINLRAIDKARWIKVEQKAGYKEVFHLRNIMVFGL